MNSVRITRENGKLRHEIYVGRHHLVADEPVDLGGEDAGPSPDEYLAASLGTCTAITLQMYSQRKSWPLEDAEVRVSIQPGAGATKFNRSIHLKGALTSEQKARLLQIANACPIHKILSGKIEIETLLAE